MLKQQARSRHAKARDDARRKLACPPVPASVAYLAERLQQLHGRSGIGMAGFARLSHLEIDAAARLHGWRLAPHEIEALIYLDDVLLSPPKDPPKPP